MIKVFIIDKSGFLGDLETDTICGYNSKLAKNSRSRAISHPCYLITTTNCSTTAATSKRSVRYYLKK